MKTDPPFLLDEQGVLSDDYIHQCIALRGTDERIVAGFGAQQPVEVSVHTSADLGE